MRAKKRILCIDDDEQELSTLAFTLRTHGYYVFSTPIPDDAISLFADNAVDLVLCDMFMPKMNGSDLILRLKNLKSSVPMILIGDARKMNGFVHGADALLHKPSLSPAELYERIKIMSARKRGPRPGTRQAAKPLSSLTACLA